MFAYQSKFRTINFYNTRTEYVISWRSKGLYTINIIPINNDHLLNMKYVSKRIALQFDSILLVVH